MQIGQLDLKSIWPSNFKSSTRLCIYVCIFIYFTIWNLFSKFALCI